MLEKSFICIFMKFLVDWFHVGGKWWKEKAQFLYAYVIFNFFFSLPQREKRGRKNNNISVQKLCIFIPSGKLSSQHFDTFLHKCFHSFDLKYKNYVFRIKLLADHYFEWIAAYVWNINNVEKKNTELVMQHKGVIKVSFKYFIKSTPYMFVFNFNNYTYSEIG